MKFHSHLPDDLAAWVLQQPVFFTGSAPTHGPHVNVSPKGLADSHFAVLSPRRCAYIDRTGSGCETIAHSYENGRLCLMFMSFGSTPRILRIYARASVVEWDDSPRFQNLVAAVAHGSGRKVFDAARAVIVCDIWQVQTSCGYGVPRVKKGIYSDRHRDQNGHGDGGKQAADETDDAPVDIEKLLGQGCSDTDKRTELCVFEERPQLDYYSAIQTSKNTVHKYQAENNAQSIDGLPGLKTARRDNNENLWLGDASACLRRMLAEKMSVAFGFALGLLFCLIVVAFRPGPK